ncbi:MAG TPA: protein kinase [Actinomycetota bacterium]
MSSDPRVGTVVAGYRIESVIGRGGMSVVYLAHHEGLERKAALKLLAPELAENDAFRQRFIRESRIAAGLDHPNVIPVYDAGEADGLLYIAMRYVPGSDLRTVLAESGQLGLPDVQRVIDQLAAALDAAHEEGLVHRDVKPANVLLSRATPPARVGHLYLADFGLTKRSLSGTGITRSGQFVGTIDYVAPEQIRSEAVDGRTDVYSLGCLLYECLTGAPPFVRETEVAVMFAHLNDRPEAPTDERPDLPDAIDAVVARAMAKEPGERFSSSGELAAASRDALRPAAAEVNTSVHTATSSPGRPHRRRLLLGAGIVVIAIVVATALVAALANGNAPGHGSGPTSSSSGGPTSPAPSGTQSSGASALPADFQGVARLNARTGRLETSFAATFNQMAGPEGSQVPRPFIAAEGALWVDRGGFGVTQIDKLDPGTGAVKDTVDLRVTGVQSLAFAAGQSSLWVLTIAGILGVGDDTLYRIDPGSDRVLASIPIGRAGAGVAADDQTVWAVASTGGLHQIDTGSNRVGRSIPGLPTASGIAIAGGSVWVADAVQGVVYRVHRDSANVDTIHMPGGVDGIAADAGHVWVMDRASGTVVPIDPSSGRPGQQIRVGSLPSAIAVGGGSVWIASPTEGTIWRVDESSGQASSFPVGGDPGPGWVSVGEGGVWTTVG